MKKRILLLSALAALVALIVGVVPASGANGNGAPSGSHYNLNVIGVPKGKSADMTGTSGHTIFVGLGSDGSPSSCRILLEQGDYRVLDRNCTDDGQARFRLPGPEDPNNTGVSQYSVFARALGTPGGSADVVSCFYDQQTATQYCSVADNILTLKRETGKSSFQNVTKNLLYIYANIDTDTQIERVPLFSDPLDSYWWDWTNKGLKLAQLRFYHCQTVVPEDPTGSQDDSDCFN
jgi:hypothetical protein